MEKSAGSDSDLGERTASTSPTSPDDVSWTLLDLEEIEDAYWEHVAPALRSEGRDPETDRPSHKWLSANGFRGLTYALSEYHDLTFAEFWNDVLDLQSSGYSWDIDHQPTIDALEQYLDRQQSRLSWSQGSVETHRYRLAQYVRAYEGVNGSSDIFSPVAPESDVDDAEAIDRCWETFDALDRRLSRTTLQRIYKTVSSFYDTQVSRHEILFNPTEGLDYDWSDDERGDGAKVENPALAPTHVRALYEAAADTRERLLVVALCAWGLRSGEVAALHTEQLVLDEENPRIVFDERKNGPGTVAMIYGVDVARDRLTAVSDRSNWNGYLFPSDRSDSGHRTRGTIRNWFQDLADQAGLPEEIKGATPVPQMARRFWYDRYSETIEQLVEHQIQEIAEEQGSASADVVWDNYLSEERRRELRREFMKRKLSGVFDVDDSPDTA